MTRRGLMLTTLAGATGIAAPAAAQVDVGDSSVLRNLVPAAELEQVAAKEYGQTLAQARAEGALASAGNPQLLELHAIAKRLIPFTSRWNSRASGWNWEVNLISSKQINAFCMPGGKIAFYSGILDQLQLSTDEAAMIMGHEMAHALREHARERISKTQLTGTGLSMAAQWLGLGDLGNVAAEVSTQLLTLKFSRDDESEADLVGLELAARAGYRPQAAVSLWQKMSAASASSNSLSFLSTHPTGPDRIELLQENVPRVQGLYEQAGKR